MAIKPCELVLLKRYPKNEMLRQNFPDQYCSSTKGVWVQLRSNAMLFNKGDLKRDVLRNSHTLDAYRIIGYDGKSIETEFEMVELMEKKSFGFIIRRPAGKSAEGVELFQHLKLQWAENSVDYERSWLNSPHNADLFDREMVITMLVKVQETFPDSKFEAKELFIE